MALTLGEIRVGICLHKTPEVAPYPFLEAIAAEINALEAKRAECDPRAELQRRISLAQTKLEEAAIAMMRVYSLIP